MNTDENMVSTVKYSIIIQQAANMQKDDRASREVIVPTKKATAFVNEVIVMEGPA